MTNSCKVIIATILVGTAVSTGALAADIVNPQITDAVTQTNVKVLGDAPAVATGNLYQASAQALSNAAHNATSAQQNASTVLQATTTQGVSTLYEADTASTGIAESKIMGESGPAH
ncbi:MULTISPECIES: RebB family R body protein [Cohaesibacter]|uniref:RebB family R body protein n=1 Tax=Cohaesibacter TaxID=655352 RepID=UPI000DE9F4AA|nr:MULTISPECIES: RebB family R body protein [Cohaesibacter]TLP43778.1 glycerol-3-phosphate dehydrogenase [Cohaesibacter sp. CAU 1516]